MAHRRESPAPMRGIDSLVFAHHRAELLKLGLFMAKFAASMEFDSQETQSHPWGGRLERGPSRNKRRVAVIGANIGKVGGGENKIITYN